MSVLNNTWHPDIQNPWREWSESETLHLIAVYSNPFRWYTRRELFNDFTRHMRHAANVKLHVVELAYGDRPFEVTGEHPHDVQVRANDEMWHKENLINLGVRSLPSDWKYAGYCDGDFHFTRHDWAIEAIHMLQHHAFVQLFSSYTDLTGYTATSDDGHSVFRQSRSFAWNYCHAQEFVDGYRKRRGGDCYGKIDETKEFPYGLPPGATGGAWAWTKEAFNIVGGMLDTCILGSGDWHMAFGLVEGVNVAAEMQRCTEPYVNAVLQWQKRASKLTRNVGCVDNHAIHHFHGSKSSRQYGDRWHILRKHAFDPTKDLMRDWQGVWQWCGDKPRMRDDIRKYFLARREDDSQLKGGEKVIL